MFDKSACINPEEIIANATRGFKSFTDIPLFSKKRDLD